MRSQKVFRLQSFSAYRARLFAALRNRQISRFFAPILAIILIFCWPNGLAAYAVLAHQAIIDSAWDTSIRPLLLKRFPGSTPEQLKEAHGYAYGGAIIQDMGY